jgi:hypothetical protein
MRHVLKIALMCLSVGACGPKPPPDGAGFVVSILPASAVVAPGASQRFTAQLSTASPASVTWSVMEGAAGGTISSDGVYQAPPVLGTAHVVAADRTAPDRTAIAEVTIAIPVVVSIQPASLALPVGPNFIQYTANVSGSDDTSVVWSVEEGAAGGAVDASGLYASPNAVGVYHVVATSHADPSKFARATITITPNGDDLIDHGGLVISATRTFLLFWGDVTAFPADARTGMETLLGGLQGSSYLAVIDQYLRGVAARTDWSGTFFDPSAPAGSASAPAIGDAACRALVANGVTPRMGDFVVVSTSNFPSDMAACAWHSSTTCAGQTILFAYAPNPLGTRCGTATDTCASGYSSATTSLLLLSSHELLESMTDPVATAWATKGGFEVADGCGDLFCAHLSTGVVPVTKVYSNAVHTCVGQ